MIGKCLIIGVSLFSLSHAYAEADVAAANAASAAASANVAAKQANLDAAQSRYDDLSRNDSASKEEMDRALQDLQNAQTQLQDAQNLMKSANAARQNANAAGTHAGPPSGSTANPPSSTGAPGTPGHLYSDNSPGNPVQGAKGGSYSPIEGTKDGFSGRSGVTGQSGTFQAVQGADGNWYAVPATQSQLTPASFTQNGMQYQGVAPGQNLDPKGASVVMKDGTPGTPQQLAEAAQRTDSVAGHLGAPNAQNDAQVQSALADIGRTPGQDVSVIANGVHMNGADASLGPGLRGPSDIISPQNGNTLQNFGQSVGSANPSALNVLSCQAGSCGNQLGQSLSNQLQIPVTTYTGNIQVSPNGSLVNPAWQYRVTAYPGRQFSKGEGARESAEGLPKPKTDTRSLQARQEVIDLRQCLRGNGIVSCP